MATITTDKAQDEQEFISRISDNISSGLTTIGIAMGIETGLFKVMALMDGPKTSEEIAEIGNYKERYVREWLGGMASADIIVYYPTNQTYWLPPHHHAIKDKASLAMSIPVMCSAFFDVASCFKKDGPPGVTYDKYNQLDALMTGLNGPFLRDAFVQTLLPSLPSVHQQLLEGINVLDIGCSQGVSTRTIAKHYPNSQVLGIDIDEYGIKCAQQEAHKMDLKNVRFLCESATSLHTDWTEKYQYVLMHKVLHDLPHPMKTLNEVFRVMTVGGTLSVIDTPSYTKLEDNLMKARDYAKRAFILSMMNCVPTSLSTGEGPGLGAMYGREKAQQMIEEAQFEVVDLQLIQNALHYLCKKN